MPRRKNYPICLAIRISPEADEKIDAAVVRLGVDRAQVVRWWIDEMPEGYVPKRFAPKKSNPKE